MAFSSDPLLQGRTSYVSFRRRNWRVFLIGSPSSDVELKQADKTIDGTHRRASDISGAGNRSDVRPPSDRMEGSQDHLLPFQLRALHGQPGQEKRGRRRV